MTVPNPCTTNSGFGPPTWLESTNFLPVLRDFWVSLCFILFYFKSRRDTSTEHVYTCQFYTERSRIWPIIFGDLGYILRKPHWNPLFSFVGHLIVEFSFCCFVLCFSHVEIRRLSMATRPRSNQNASKSQPQHVLGPSRDFQWKSLKSTMFVCVSSIRYVLSFQKVPHDSAGRDKSIAHVYTCRLYTERSRIWKESVFRVIVTLVRLGVGHWHTKVF